MRTRHHRAALLLLLLCACDRFPRDNPVERSMDGELAISLSEDALIINDAAGASPFNNGNGKVEPRETVLVTVPLDAFNVTEMLTISVNVEDLNDGRCVTSVMEHGAAGSQLVPIVLPPTMNDTPSPLLVGAIEIQLGQDDCDPETPLEFALSCRIIQRDVELRVPFTVAVSALDGSVSLDAVVIDDDGEGGDGERDLDPGETVLLFPSLENTGDALLRRIELGVADDDPPCVQSTRISRTASGRLGYGDLTTGQTSAAVSGSLELVVDPDCGDAERVELTFDVRDASGQRWMLPWSRKLVVEAPDAGLDDDGGVEAP